LYSPSTLLKDFTYSEIERPIVAQIYGKTPDLFYKVAHIVCELGFDGLDINMGCPAKKVAASGCGAALIRTPRLAQEIVRAARQGVLDWHKGQTLRDVGFGSDMIAQVEAANLQRSGQRLVAARAIIPVSIKTRLGYDRVVIDEWLTTLLAEQPAVISLHGRTLEQGYKGQADWNAIARAVELAEGSDTLIIGNGDVADLSEAYERVRETGVDGVLIGRGAQGEPWIFRGKAAVKAALRGDCTPAWDGAPVSVEERFRVIGEHSDCFERFSGPSRFVAMRKHLTWYCRNFRGAAEMRARMTRASAAQEVRRCLSEFLRHPEGRGDAIQAFSYEDSSSLA